MKKLIEQGVSAMKKITLALATFLMGIGAGVAYGRRPPALHEQRTQSSRSGSEKPPIDPSLSSLHTADPDEALRAEAAAVKKGNEIARSMGKNLKLDSIPQWDDDITVTNRVRTNLGEDPLTSRLPRMNIDTFHGKCTAHGHVDSFNQFKSVQRVLAETKGVKDVQMHVSVGNIAGHSI